MENEQDELFPENGAFIVESVVNTRTGKKYLLVSDIVRAINRDLSVIRRDVSKHTATSGLESFRDRIFDLL